MTIDMTGERATAAATAERNGVRIDVDRLSRRVRVGRREEVTLLDAVSFSIPAGELVAIVGPSGAGKTTLLKTIAGIAPATAGAVRFDGVDVHANAGAFRSVLGYVPQDDIIHADLPLARTLRYAARLRLPSSTSSADVRRRRRRRPRRRRAHRPGRRAGRCAQRRAAQAGQHRRRAAHRSARVLPRRADVGPRPADERRADHPPAPARRPVGHGRVHDAFRRRPGDVRPHRVHDPGRTGRLRRNHRRGARVVRGRLGPRALRAAGRSRAHRRTGRRAGRGGAAGQGDRRRHPATGGRRAHAVGQCSPSARSRSWCATA